MFHQCFLHKLLKRPGKQIAQGQSLEWTPLCAPLNWREQRACFLFVSHSDPSPPFPSLGFDCAPASSGQHKHFQPASPMGAEFVSCTTICRETMQFLGENKFVFHWSLTVDNRKSRVPSDVFAFLLVGVHCLHLVTGMNIDVPFILLCWRMRGMWAAALRFWVTMMDVVKEKYNMEIKQDIWKYAKTADLFLWIFFILKCELRLDVIVLVSSLWHITRNENHVSTVICNQ